MGKNNSKKEYTSFKMDIPYVDKNAYTFGMR